MIFMNTAFKTSGTFQAALSLLNKQAHNIVQVGV